MCVAGDNQECSLNIVPVPVQVNVALSSRAGHHIDAPEKNSLCNLDATKSSEIGILIKLKFTVILKRFDVQISSQTSIILINIQVLVDALSVITG